ncbi:MAG: hypothetical protein K0S32_137 [Bacteroidetes bacterium]|nr:hypothetical protein [Bacteroidota bacterium]
MLLSLGSFSQTMRLSGNVNDTAAKQVLPNALLMAVKFKDSTLVDFSRTDKNGFFKPIKVPVDTYIVIISHPNFSDKTYLLVPSKKDTAFAFKNIVLPGKSVQLNEVEVIAYKDKMYYKGDTLQFTADSFKVKQNATVEDLLKKLPGMKVDVNGKITVQGKTVDQVLVDGDEFFGTDPTIATKNLNANTVETVQVYDKKNENTEGGGDETVKVVNLKLKEDSKKGYFGKITGASDFQKFYENDILVNKFKKNMKVSAFGLFANTPKQAFSWRDANDYGLNNESGGNYDAESNTWTSNGNNPSGVPQTLKTGFYFNDKFGKNTKINADYTFKQNRLFAGSETNTQFFLQDTSYSNAQIVKNNSLNQGHNFSMRFTQKLDSLTELTVRPRINYKKSEYNNSQIDDFISQSDELTRQTNIENKGNSESIDASTQIKIEQKFMKKDRVFSVNYTPSYYNSTAANNLGTDFRYFKGQLPDSSLLQKRNSESYRLEQNASLSYTEPWSKKFKTEIGYGLSHNLNNSFRKTLDYNGQAYDIINPNQSNDFRNKRITHRVGGKLIYDVKKYRISIGTNYRNIYQENINVTKEQKLSNTFHNVLPFANFNYRINQGSNFTINYSSNNQQPDLQQLQPVADNTDPNRISIGNPALKPQFSNNINTNYYFYKGVSDRNFYAGGNFNHVINEINERTSFDSLGRSVTTPVNINGNYFIGWWAGGGFPVFKRWMKIMYSFNSDFNNNVAYINDQQNVTQNLSLSPGLQLEKQSDKFEAGVSGYYHYNVPKQTISVQSNQPYYSYDLNAHFNIKLPANFRIMGEGNYTDNGNRASGYNINYVIVNAAVNKTFFKAENLITSIEAFDIFNQNISNTRSVESNKIVDRKTQVIKRYFLLRAIYKFNSKTQKKEDKE